MPSNSTLNNPHDSTSSAISSSNENFEDKEERGTQHQEAGDEEEDRRVVNDGDDYDPDSDDDKMPPLEGQEEDETENETDEDSEDNIRVRALPSMHVLPLVQLEIYFHWSNWRYTSIGPIGEYLRKKYENENETRSVYTSPETVDVTRIINGWTIGRPLMDLYFRPHHESPSIEFNQLSYGRNIDSDSDESDE